MTQKRRHPLAQHVDEDRILAAIVSAEAHTTGRIHATLSHDARGTTLAGAVRAFRAMRLDRTADRNGVLFYAVPAKREFAVVGDAGIHKKVGQEFWDRVVGAMSERMKRGELTDGLVHGIEEAGKELKTHFPRSTRGA